MATEKILTSLVINKIDSQETYNKMKAQGLINEDELYLTPESSSGASGDYLPLSGGTMTGVIDMNNNVIANGQASALLSNADDYAIVYKKWVEDKLTESIPQEIYICVEVSGEMSSIASLTSATSYELLTLSGINSLGDIIPMTNAQIRAEADFDQGMGSLPMFLIMDEDASERRLISAPFYNGTQSLQIELTFDYNASEGEHPTTVKIWQSGLTPLV